MCVFRMCGFVSVQWREFSLLYRVFGVYVKVFQIQRIHWNDDHYAQNYCNHKYKFVCFFIDVKIFYILVKNSCSSRMLPENYHHDHQLVILIISNNNNVFLVTIQIYRFDAQVRTDIRFSKLIIFHHFEICSFHQ